MAEAEHEITPAGNIKAPSRRSCIERILAARKSLPIELNVCAVMAAVTFLVLLKFVLILSNATVLASYSSFQMGEEFNWQS